MKPYDTLGIALHSSQPAEVERVANEVREWLNERAEQGYAFVCAISICSVYSVVLVVRQDRDPMEHGD